MHLIAFGISFLTHSVNLILIILFLTLLNRIDVVEVNTGGEVLRQLGRCKVTVSNGGMGSLP